jgi:acyl dehydratase
MQTVAVTWPVIGNIREYLDSDSFPGELLMTQVHYSEHIVIHRLIRPGDRLTIKGEIAAVLPRKSGTHTITRLEAFDSDNEPVFTEYTGALLRGVECEDDGAGQESLPAVPPEPLMFKHPKWESIIPIAPLQPYIYDGCTDIFFPIHTSPRFAEQVGLPGIILQGTATLAFAVREMINREADGDPFHVKEISCRFTGMVMPGTEITVSCNGVTEAGDNRNVFFNVLNAGGERAVSNGYIKLKEAGDEG